MLYWCRHQWGLLFSKDAVLSDLIAQVLVILTGYVIFDGLSSVLGGVVKGVGKQLAATPIVIISYYAIGLPLAALFGFKLKMGVKGLCLGMLVGTAVHAICFFMLVWCLDWNLEAHRAAARVGVTKEVSDTMEGLMVDQEDDSKDQEEEDEQLRAEAAEITHMLNPDEDQHAETDQIVQDNKV